LFAKWHLEGDRQPCELAIVIPALGEGEQLWATLNSIAANPHPLLRTSLVVVVINSREDSAPELIQQNAIDLEYLRRHANRHGGFGSLRLSWVDATSETVQLPRKNGGVGLARKIGCELVLTHLADQGVLVQLDADTLVDKNYLHAITTAFCVTDCQAAVIPYRHQTPESANQRSAINHYELYMRCHTLGLRWAQSPYAYHSIGSTIACRKQAYRKAGGMNCRSAGEDFYFLQQLAKTSGVSQLCGTVVRPAARISRRTPFGTGQVINELCNNSGQQLFYAPQCYAILRCWLSLIKDNLDRDGMTLLGRGRAIDVNLANYLEQQKFVTTWQRLCTTHNNHRRRLHAFHEWFDALKTFRCINHLSTTTFPMDTADKHVPPLLETLQLDQGETVEQWLQIMLAHDGVI